MHQINANWLDMTPVVWRVDNTIQRINHHPAESVILFVNGYPLESDLFCE